MSRITDPAPASASSPDATAQDATPASPGSPGATPSPRAADVEPAAPGGIAAWRASAQGPGGLKDMLRFTLSRAGDKKLTQVASSLTFTTVLATVPMLAVILALFTAFPLFNDFRVALEEFLLSSLMPPTVSDNVMNYLNQFAAQASRLTAVGSLFLIVTSIMLIMTIDETLNNIWQVRQQRPLRQRILVYWAILSLGPILVGASLWATTLLTRESLGRIGELPAIANAALSFLPVIIAGLALAALFVFVPNRHVKWRDALWGGFFTAIVLEAMKAGFAYYLTRFPSYTIIYGAFAVLPIFLMWIYLSWLAVLAGATIASTLPSLRRQRRQPAPPVQGAGFLDAIAILRLLWHSQRQEQPGLSLRQLAEALQHDPDAVADILQVLKPLGYVADTDDKHDDRWLLACDPYHAGAGRLVDAILVDRAQTQAVLPGKQLETTLCATLLPGRDVALARWLEADALKH